MLTYREHFKPSATLAKPYAILATAAIAADTDAEAERIAASADLHFVSRAKGEYPAAGLPRTRPPPIRTRRSTANASPAIAGVLPSAASPPCGTACGR